MIKSEGKDEKIDQKIKISLDNLSDMQNKLKNEEINLQEKINNNEHNGIGWVTFNYVETAEKFIEKYEVNLYQKYFCCKKRKLNYKDTKIHTKIADVPLDVNWEMIGSSWASSCKQRSITFLFLFLLFLLCFFAQLGIKELYTHSLNSKNKVALRF